MDPFTSKEISYHRTWTETYICLETLVSLHDMLQWIFLTIEQKL